MKKATETSGKARSKMSSVALGDPSSKRSNPATTSIMIPPDRPAHKPPRATFQKGIQRPLFVLRTGLRILVIPPAYSFRSFHCRQAIPNRPGVDLAIQLVCATVEWFRSLLKATRKNVAAIRIVARIVPLKVPETLETPPRRLR